MLWHSAANFFPSFNDKINLYTCIGLQRADFIPWFILPLIRVSLSFVAAKHSIYLYLGTKNVNIYIILIVCIEYKKTFDNGLPLLLTWCDKEYERFTFSIPHSFWRNTQCNWRLTRIVSSWIKLLDTVPYLYGMKYW